MSVVLEARGIRTGYGRLPVVFDIDLEVHEGEIVALLGANGAGKTTTLRALSGMLPLLAAVRKRFGVTMLIVDHDMALIMRICNRIYVLDNGRVIASGLPEEIREDQNVVRAYLGDKAVAA